MDPIASPVGSLWMILLLAAGLPSVVHAQTTAVASEENVRSEPNGIIIGQLHAGAPVTVVETQGGWSQITFGGVVWIPSLQTRDGGQFDLIVSAEDGENLRSEPSGRIIGRLGPGTLLNERARTPGWVEVERTAWIWTESLSDEFSGERPSAPAPPRPQPQEAEAPRSPREAPNEWIRSSGGGSPILTSPDGDTLAAARPGAEMRVLSREGSWVRVRVEGWVWSPDATDAVQEDGEEAILRGVSPQEISQDPDRFRGRLVEVELQFISVERAESVRADFQAGEPFLLTRSLGPERLFVYVAIPSSEMERAERLTPLERIVVVGRVRTGSAALTGNTLLDLLEMRVVR